MEITEAEIFSRSDRVSGWFTHKNRDYINSSETVPGLDLGNNTLSERGDVDANLSALGKSLNLDISKFVFARQIHGTGVTTVNEAGINNNTDALITNRPGLILAIQVADCAAVLIADDTNGVVAAVHAGWRGAASGVVNKTIKRMVRDCGAKRETLSAFVSPAISIDYFEVGNEVASIFPNQFVDYETWKKPHIDLKAFLVHQLCSAGVHRDLIQVDEGCTWRDDNRYYSYRREDQMAGRMLGLIRLNY